MSATLEDLKTRALQLAPPERDELVRTLIESIDGEPDGTPEEIAQAWNEEIARRIADFEAGPLQAIEFDNEVKRVIGPLLTLPKLGTPAPETPVHSRCGAIPTPRTIALNPI